jgi:flagellar biosynthesis component FlhA
MFDLGIFTGSAKIVTFGLGGVALFGGLWLLIQKLTSGKSSDKRSVVHKIKQAVTQKKIEEVTKEQEVIVKQLKQAEQASEDSKEKIKKIVRKAAVEMNTILKEDSIAKIDDNIDDDWEKL